MVQWEYKEVGMYSHQVERRINALGAEGWEAYSVTNDGTTGDGVSCVVVHLKRQIK